MPVLWRRAILAPFTCRGPAWPRSYNVSSVIIAPPVAPIGWPREISPPSVLIGMGPLEFRVGGTVNPDGKKGGCLTD
jgi:hypothetical protein